jgi:hypothetical protein
MDSFLFLEMILGKNPYWLDGSLSTRYFASYDDFFIMLLLHSSLIHTGIKILNTVLYLNLYLPDSSH